MGQLGGEDIAWAPHVNGQLEKSKRTLARVCAHTGEKLTPPQLDKVSVTAAVMSDNATQNVGFK